MCTFYYGKWKPLLLTHTTWTTGLLLSIETLIHQHLSSHVICCVWFNRERASIFVLLNFLFTFFSSHPWSFHHHNFECFIKIPRFFVFFFSFISLSFHKKTHICLFRYLYKKRTINMIIFVFCFWSYVRHNKSIMYVMYIILLHTRAWLNFCFGFFIYFSFFLI